MNDEEPEIISDLRRQLEELKRENDRLTEILGLKPSNGLEHPAFGQSKSTEHEAPPSPVDRSSAPESKVAFFQSLFVGRGDVYALRWESGRTGKHGWSPAVVGGFANARSTDKEYAPLTPRVVADHLAGKVHAGLYPLLGDDTCRLVVCDFDGPGWALDALAYFHSAQSMGVTSALERSRSGDGAHVWIFFRDAVPATIARRLGTLLLREAMNLRGELDLASYDRLFPAQDFMPKGSFGNLIALPLQKECRDRGTTVFLDPSTMKPMGDQWAYLSALQRISRIEVESILATLPEVRAGPEERTFQRPRDVTPIAMPETVAGVAKAMLEIVRSGLSPALLAGLKHLASLHNPAFYEKERLRFSTWDTPRMLRCYGENLESLLLPRGLTEKAVSVVSEAGSRLVIRENRSDPEPIEFAPTFQLREDQEAALRALRDHELGVLVAPPGSGKTVVACALIAHHQRPTLIIVDRKPLVEQWTERLATHLGLTAKEIGQIGGGRNKTTGIVDVAMAQSLARREDLNEISNRYGLVVVDECHHVPAVTFERCVKQICVRRWLGLTATPYRRDGLQGLIAMYCGPIRHRMHDEVDTENHFRRELIVHHTNLDVSDDGAHIQDLFRALVDDEARTTAICEDVVTAAAPWADPFPAHPVTLLFPSAAEIALYALNPPGAFAQYAKNVNRYTGGIVVGVNDVISKLSSEETVCPKTSIILAGYSQGAMVMHDVGAELVKTQRQGLLTPVRATILLGDGDRTGSTKAHQFGIKNGAGVGVRTWLRLKIPGLASDGSVADVIQSARTAEVCNWGDLVCDFKLSDFVSPYHGYKVHIGYVSQHGTTLVPDQAVAAASAWAASLVPVITSGSGGVGTWSSAEVDGTQIDKIVCTTLTFCIADDFDGNVLTSNDPTGGASAWAIENIASDQLNAAISCPSSSECLIGDANGAIWTTTDVTDGSSATWSTNYSDPYGGLSGISCPSVSLCVASDLSGNIMWTTDPGGSWSSSDVDGSNSIWDMDCPSVSFCVAVDLDGNVLTSTDPESGNWTISDVDGTNELYSISCVGVHFCAAIDASGNVITTVNPELSTAWRSDYIDPEASADGGAEISCPSVNLCVAGDDAGQVESSGNPLGGHLTWIATSLTTNKMFAMSCPTTTECIGGDDGGNIYWEQT